MALSFVVRNMGSVVRSRDWRERLMDHPALMAEVSSLFTVSPHHLLTPSPLT